MQQRGKNENVECSSRINRKLLQAHGYYEFHIDGWWKVPGKEEACRIYNKVQVTNHHFSNTTALLYDKSII